LGAGWTADRRAIQGETVGAMNVDAGLSRGAGPDDASVSEQDFAASKGVRIVDPRHAGRRDRQTVRARIEIQYVDDQMQATGQTPHAPCLRIK